MVRILHLSDMHFQSSPGSGWDSAPVLLSVGPAVRELVEAGLEPDVVAITGDIAYSGTAAEYEMASQWIDNVLLPSLPDAFPLDRILMVPGNHDVNRSSVGETAKATQAALRTGKSQKQIARVMAHVEERNVLLRRHSEYMAFAGTYGVGEKDVPWWVKELTVR